MQVINGEGMAPVLNKNISSAYPDWDFSGFVLRTMPDCPARYVTLFPDDEARLFPGRMTEAVNRNAQGPGPFVDGVKVEDCGRCSHRIKRLISRQTREGAIRIECHCNPGAL